MDNSITQVLEKRIGELQAEMEALDKQRQGILASLRELRERVETYTTLLRLEKGEPSPSSEHREVRRRRAGRTYADMAADVLRARPGAEMHVRDILEALRKSGKAVGGKKPYMNLYAALHHDSRFMRGSRPATFRLAPSANRPAAHAPGET